MLTLDVIYYFFVFFAIYIQIFFIITLFENRKVMFKKTEAGVLAYYPKISIIVPCWNEENTVVKTINSLLNLNYPKDKLEILVVDDGSTDNTWKVLNEMPQSPNVLCFTKENGGKYTALNFGLEKMTGEFVACLDADSEVMPDALLKMLPKFADENIMAVIPAAIVYEPKTIVQYAQKVEYTMSVFFKRALSLVDALHVTPGTLPIYRKEVFAKIGNFRHGHNGEDMEIAFRMHEHDMKVAQVHDALVYTIPPATIKTLYKQRTRWIGSYFSNIIDYRHMILNPKYKTFAMFTLPAGLISIFSVIYFFWFSFTHLLQFLISSISRMFVTNFHFATNFGLPDWFLVGSKPLLFLAIFAYLLVLTCVVIGYRMVEGKVPWSFNFLIFIVLYSVIEPFWLMKAMWNIATKKTASWR